jgi:hypothetical protein
MLKTDVSIAKVMKYSKNIEQPKNDHYYNYDIEDLFNLRIHGKIIVYQPQSDTNDNERYKNPE